MSVQNVTLGVSADLRASGGGKFFLPGAADFAEGLNLGQIIKGKVMRQFEGGSGRYLVNFDGNERVVDSVLPLTTGELLHGRVIGLGDRVEVQRIFPGDEAPQPQPNEQTGAEGFLGGLTLTRQERMFNDIATRFRADMTPADKAVLMRATRTASDASAMTMVGVMVNKLGLSQSNELLWPVYRALVREDSSSAALYSGNKEVTQLSTVPNVEPNTQSTTVRQLADVLLKQMEQKAEHKDENDVVNRPATAPDNNNFVPGAAVGAVQQDLEGNDSNDPRHTAHWLLNAQTGGTVAHRIGTVPLLLGDQLVEVDLSFFEQQKEKPNAVGSKHRRVMFSLRTDKLGTVEIAANVVGKHVRLQIATGDQDSTATASTHAEALRSALTDSGWEIDEIAYETRQADNQNGVVRSVVEHIISQDSLNRLV